MQRLFSLVLCLIAINLYSQEFDGTYKVPFVSIEGDGLGTPSGMSFGLNKITLIIFLNLTAIKMSLSFAKQ